MLDHWLGESPAVRSLQLRAAKLLFNAGLSADRATIAGAVTGVLAGIAFGAGSLSTGLALLALSAALDALDGTIARHFGAATARGGVLDLSADRLVEVAVLVGIAWPRPELYFSALLLAASWYLNITVFLAVGAALERRGPKLIDYPPGLLERTEALIFFVILATARPVGPWLCYLFTALEVVTAAQRLQFGWRYAR